MDADWIVVTGAREHNLRNITVRIPRGRMTVITGLSGSGKSSLAFDTLYAEGRRRYVESLSAYARQFLDQIQKPDVDSIDGLSPAIAIEQRSAGANPRSIVATTTEVYDFLRLLYAHIGERHCPSCGGRVSRSTVDDMVETLLREPGATRLVLLAPLTTGRSLTVRAFSMVGPTSAGVSARKPTHPIASARSTTSGLRNDNSDAEYLPP